ncbi:syntaxin of plants SYP7 [Angomonas deanei]|nr:syntaxin of plants SYP7 [Angomonas deanei]EPY41231.1 syntaxin of plants SYP7 [Angomonas deanei]EPY43764.1 syntaxin of plants SYP7 [Angomonas deanei]|eukprot:EPY40768.1 syntaxin of plants SYP7 [Angomonas deanei]
MREMLDVIEKRGGRVHGTVFSANEIVRRQNTFNELQNSYHDIRQFYQSVVPRVHAARPTEDGVQAVDEFAQVQEHAQREETALQDEILDRLTYGLRELRETGVTINDELETQDDMLNDIDKDMTTLQIKLRSANEKIDKLLASMSNGGKICTIVGLMVGIIVLLSLIF